MYKPKYKITRDETLKGNEVLKIMNGMEKEMNNQFIWKILPFALLIAFVIVTIVYLASGG